VTTKGHDGEEWSAQCDAHHRERAALWWHAFPAALDAWWRQRPVTGTVAEDVWARLGEPDVVKRWLLRLYTRRLRKLEQSGNIG
jgi:hypothetical protein